MQQARPSLSALQIRVLVITFEPADAARAYVAETAPAWPVIADDGRNLYHAYAMGRARWRHLWGVATWMAYLRELGHGLLPRWPVADTFQQGGDVLIDPRGTVRFLRVGSGPGDRPRVERILEARRAGSA